MAARRGFLRYACRCRGDREPAFTDTVGTWRAERLLAGLLPATLEQNAVRTLALVLEQLLLGERGGVEVGGLGDLAFAHEKAGKVADRSERRDRGAHFRAVLQLPPMSLAPVIGYLGMLSKDEQGRASFLDDLSAINQVLVEADLPEHVEPQTLPEYTLRVEMNHLGTTWLHHLRRLQAHVLQDPSWTHQPCTDDDEPWNDSAIDDELSVYIRSHLIVHADTEGYYVPIEFDDVLYGAPGGSMLGSSQRLVAELRQLAPYLGIVLDAEGNLSDAEAARIAPCDETDPAHREKAAWLLLFECARQSVSMQTLIAFT